MHCLITGGAGFIGSHLSEALLSSGHTVTAIDDLSTGSVRNVRHLREKPQYQLVVDDVRNTRVLAELVDEADQVFHLAAAVGVELIVRDPVHTIEINLRGTEEVLAAARKKKKRVLIASTSEVYGKSLDVPFREDGDLTLGATKRSRWSYAASKAVDEFLAMAYYRQHGVPTVIVRFFNTVGPRQTGRYGMVVPRFVQQALAGEPITVYGDGRQTRCFAHVADVVEASARLMNTAGAEGDVFNIGGTQEVSILDLAHRVKKTTGSSSPIHFVPYEEAYAEGFEDMARRVPSVEKLKTAIGFAPERTLDMILEDVIAESRGEPVPDPTT